MDKELAEKLVEALQEMGDYDADIYEGYSGRGMYGERTTAVIFSDWSALFAALYVVGYEDGFNDAKDNESNIPNPEAPEGLRTDQLGLNYIIY